MFDTITKDNWMLYAMKNYDNPTVEKEEEFHDDLKRFNQMLIDNNFAKDVVGGGGGDTYYSLKM